MGGTNMLAVPIAIVPWIDQPLSQDFQGMYRMDLWQKPVLSSTSQNWNWSIFTSLHHYIMEWNEAWQLDMALEDPPLVTTWQWQCPTSAA